MENNEKQPSEMTVFRPAPGTGRDGEGAHEPADRGYGSHVLVDRHVVFEDNPLRKQLAHFVGRIRGASVPVGTLEEDIRSLSLAQDLLDRLHAQGVGPGGASDLAAPTAAAGR